MRATVIRARSGARYFVDDKEVTQEEFDLAFPSQEIGVPGGQLPACWPRESMALAVHPDQVQEAQESAARKGVPTEFTKQGHAVIRDQGHQRDYLRAYQMRNNNAGYGDWGGR